MSADPTPMPVTVLNWKPLTKGALRGWCDLQIGTLLLFDCGVFSKDGHAWVSLPTKPRLTKEGTVKRDATGKNIYVASVDWADKGAAGRFNSGALLALEIAHPGATK